MALIEAWRRLLVLAGFALAAGPALACGYCVEDKIASTYDHAVVVKAVGAGHHVAFFHLEGPLAKDDATRRALLSAAEAVPGVDKGSVRLALETLTLSFAFDPKRTSLVKAQGALDRKLAARKLSLFPMRTIERPGELKEIRSR
jgi:hypothetical protein